MCLTYAAFVAAKAAQQDGDVHSNICLNDAEYSVNSFCF